MGCVSQKQNRQITNQQSRTRLHSQQLMNIQQISIKKLGMESPNTMDTKQQIIQFRSIDISDNEEFILKRERKLIQSNKGSPTTTPKFNIVKQNGIGQRKQKIMV